MAEAVAPDEVDYQKHQKRSADHDGDRNLQTELQVVKVGNSADNVRAEAAKQLRGEHVDTNGSGMSAAGHHVVQNSSNRPVIPGHKKTGNEEAGEHDRFLFRLDGQQEKGGG